MLIELLSDNILVAITQQPWAIQVWVYWLMLVNTASIAFLRERDAKVIFAVWIANATTMTVFYWLMGYVRLLGLSHVLWWTPMLIWLWPKLRNAGGNYRIWLWLLFASDAASLLIDYVDVARWVLGERAAG